MDLSSLIAEVSERSQIPGIAPRGEHLTRLAEAELNKRLMNASQEATLTVTTDTEGVALLPADFLTMRRASIGGKQLRQWTLGDILSGARTGYAIRGGNLVTSEYEQPIDLSYYRGLLPLKLEQGDFASSDFDVYDFDTDQMSNWLSEEDPEIYIMALLKQWFMFKASGARGPEAQEMRQKAVDTDAYLDLLIERRNGMDIRTRFSGARMQTAGPTP